MRKISPGSLPPAVPRPVGAIILAAGSSSRLGRPKQTIVFEGVTLLRRSVAAARDAGCSPVLVVTGAYANRARQELTGLEVHELFNPGWEDGMSSSIAGGIGELSRLSPDAPAAVLMVCDQPYVTAETIGNLLKFGCNNRHPIIASAYDNTFGVPAWFSKELFDELGNLVGSSGAKDIIRKYQNRAAFLPFERGAVDVDTPEDLIKLRTHAPSAGWDCGRK
jgi:molybdenum cofactor cytidylyltransferase